MTQRFLVTIDSEEVTPAKIALALVQAGVVNPEEETPHVLAYRDEDIVIQPGSTILHQVQANACAGYAPVTIHTFRTGGET